MSNLLKMNGIPTFKNKNGFRYPKFWEYYVQHDAMHWRASEINLSQDVKDFAKADEAEKAFITNIMKLFTQNEVNKHC